MNIFRKIGKWFSDHKISKRKLIQLYSALLFNSYLKGYITGDIFKGITKNVCTPGLNCYSCPGAVTSCPLGALQTSFAASGKRTPYYMLGILILLGVIFGRWICGWLCPFGLFQELLHKIPTPKLKKSKITRLLSFFKYVILVVFVIILPLIYMLRNVPLPAFCKYICPAGTFGGALGLLINPNNEAVYAMLGPLFTWKFALMVSFIVGAIFIYRIFCRFICPLGAIYGFFNRISIFGIKLEKSKCIDCGKCVAVCGMDIKNVGDAECISCGKCATVCPTKAISWKGAKIILPENEIDAADTPEKLDTVTKSREKRVKIIKTVTAIALSVLLISALVYFNFFSDAPVETPDSSEEGEGETPSAPIGSAVGNKCPAYTLERVDGGTVNIDDLKGKTVVINFWGVWCNPCVLELPHFNELAEEYSDEVVFVVIHTNDDRNLAPEYIESHFPDSKMIFAYDIPMTPTMDMYFNLLGGTSFYPRTLVLDDEGIITFTYNGGLGYEELKAEIEKALNN